MNEELEAAGNFLADLHDAVLQTPGVIAQLGFTGSTTVQGMCGRRDVFIALLTNFARIHPEYSQENVSAYVLFDQNANVADLYRLMGRSS